MFGFEFRIPTRVVFAEGALARLGEVARPLGRHALIVVGRAAAARNGVAAQAASLLEQAGVTSVVLEGVKSNPVSALVEKGVELARAERVEIVIGLGGGSVMDSARLISLGATHEGDIWEYRVTGSMSVRGITGAILPVITIPTTGGTGSELSPAALMSRGPLKEVFFSPFLFPRAALVDPSLALTLDSRFSAQVGIDAFTQGLEAFVSNAATPFSDCFATQAMRLAWDAIPAVLATPADLNVRARLSLAGIFSLFAINQAGVGAVHALSSPLSARYDVHHGQALALLLPAVLELNATASPERFAAVGAALGLGPGKAAGDSARVTVAAVRELVASLRITRALADFGATEADIPALVKEARNPDITTNPQVLTDGQIEGVYRKLLH